MPAITKARIRAPQNRTLVLTEQDRARLRPLLTAIPPTRPFASAPEGVMRGDFAHWVPLLPDHFVDLLFLDPPYNLDKSFNGTHFSRKTEEEYTRWLDDVLSRLTRLLNCTVQDRKGVYPSSSRAAIGVLSIGFPGYRGDGFLESESVKTAEIRQLSRYFAAYQQRFDPLFGRAETQGPRIHRWAVDGYRTEELLADRRGVQNSGTTPQVAAAFLVRQPLVLATGPGRNEAAGGRTPGQ